MPYFHYKKENCCNCQNFHILPNRQVLFLEFCIFTWVNFLHERNLCGDCARRGKTGNDANGRKLFSVHTVFLSPLSDMEARPSVNTAYLDISNVPFLFCKQMHLSNNVWQQKEFGMQNGAELMQSLPAWLRVVRSLHTTLASRLPFGEKMLSGKKYHFLSFLSH